MSSSFSSSSLPSTATLENLPLIREIIACRLERQKIPALNPDMTLEYGLKIPTMMGGLSAADLDIEWIVSASSSSSASHLSSARSHKSGGVELHRHSLLSNENQILNGPTPFRREKRVPWEDESVNGGVSKLMRSREGVPLKAFPLMDDSNDFLNSNSNIS